MRSNVGGQGNKIYTLTSVGNAGLSPKSPRQFVQLAPQQLVMPKLKVPTAAKPTKKQLTLSQLKRRPLHSPSPEKTTQSEKPVQRLPPTVSPKKQNGLKTATRSFTDVFGESDDEVSFQVGLFLRL